MMYLILGIIIYFLIEKSRDKENKKLDRVEIESHEWRGQSGKTRINRRFLGPIQNKTFLSTSKLMKKSVKEYKILLEYIVINTEKDNCLFQVDLQLSNLSKIENKIYKYLNQIDRRETLNCYHNWKTNHIESYQTYVKYREIFFEAKQSAIEKLHRIY